MDMSQYRELFISETKEHLRTFNELIVALESAADDREKIDSLFRTAHSIKGMAASMGYGAITELAHKIEDLMDQVRKKLLVFEPAIADLLLEGGDLLEGLVNDADSGVTEARDLGDYLERLIGYAPKPSQEAAAPSSELTPEELSTEQSVGERQEPLLVSRQTIRVRTEILDNLINITGELITNKHRLMNVGRELGAVRLSEALEELTQLLRGLHNEVMNVRMMPVASITDRFPRIVRDLARKSGKEVAFEIEGKEIELDRGILEELGDPLIHILRNAVDHGLESAPLRLACGKEAQGKIRFSASREKDQVIITIEDDGRGMDPAKLLAKALDLGMITPEASKLLSPRDALLLICSPGFSTAQEISDVSGRGVGMDVVRSTIRTLGGTIAIESELGKGACITLKLPLTIAIINVLLVDCAGLTFAVPVTGILRTMEIRQEMITTRGKHKVFYLNEEPIPLLSMNRIFGMPGAAPRGKIVTLLVAEVRGRKVALVVDRFLGHQEVFVKPLGRPLNKMKGLAGGAILGDGKVIFILDIANIF